jgi:hypothetical protein
MATAASLSQAAKQSWVNLAPLEAAGTIRPKLLAFIAAITGQFNDGNPGDHPMRNWIAVLWQFADQMSVTADHWDELRIAAEYLYRLCFMGEQSNVQALITPAQYNAVLAAYNAQF